MNNPIELLKSIKNPQEFVINYMKSNNNPIMNNLFQMAQKNDTQGLEQFAQNMCNERGLNYNELKSLFK